MQPHPQITIPVITHLPARRRRVSRRWPRAPRWFCDLLAALVLAFMLAVIAFLTLGL